MKFLMPYSSRLWALGYLAFAFWMANGENFKVFSTMCLVWVVLEQANQRDIQNKIKQFIHAWNSVENNK